MKVHGQVGEFGDPVQQVVVKASKVARGDTVMGRHALVAQHKQDFVKVSCYSLWIISECDTLITSSR